ncbi:hypothetical protein Q6284_26220, partial [Klebsiella pneumoniae]|nr:hypothetical protein [Klebsiella pneumoniae]
KRAYCLKTQPATGETYPKSDLFNKAYALMKKSAMLLCENDSHRYSIYKADFIQKHLRMALIDAGHLG